MTLCPDGQIMTFTTAMGTSELSGLRTETQMIDYSIAESIRICLLRDRNVW